MTKASVSTTAKSGANNSKNKKTFGEVVKENLDYARKGFCYFFRREQQIWVSFLIPFGVLFLAYVWFGVFPFGERSVLSLDLNGQYVYYFDYMYDVLAGKESLFYSWSRNLSGEFMGIIGYYLASPFNIFVWLFPREMITEGLMTMMLMKVGAMGVTMSIFLSKGRGYSKLTSIVFASSYALCAYSIVQTMNPMWLDGVIALPIIALGIERLIDKGKFRMLIVFWIYAFVSCFYIGFMIAIFSVIYAVYYLFVTDRKKIISVLPSRIGLFIISALSAGMVSAFMILPVYKSLSYGKFEFSTPDYSIVENFQLVELFDKILPNSYDTVRMEGLPFIYCGVIVILMLPAFFFMKKIKGRERIAGAAVLALMIVCMYIRPVDMLWHGGQMPNWLPYRYSFMVSFLLVSFAAKAFDNIKAVQKKTIAISAVGWFMIMLYQQTVDHYHADLGSGRDVLENLTVILPAMFILFVIAALVIQLKPQFNRRKYANVVLVVVLFLEMFYSTFSSLLKQHQDIVYSTRGSYLDVILPTREVVEEIKENDDGFYRIEKNFFRTVNDPMALNMYGLSHSSSTLNAKPIELLNRLGFTARSHYTRYSGATPITSSIFGVKYELSTESNSTNDVISGGEITVDENENALPICYLADNKIKSLELFEDDPFKNQNMLLSALAGKDEYQYFSRIIDNVGLITENVTQGTTTDGHHSFKQITAGLNTQIEYTIPVDTNSALYMYFPTRYERQVNVWINKDWGGNYFNGDNHYLKKIGDFNAGDNVDLILTLTPEGSNELYFKEAQFATIDIDAVNQTFNDIKSANIDTTIEKISTTHLKINVNAAENQLLFTTIPVEEGWRVFVDGAETDYFSVLDSLIAVDVPVGQHTVELVFTTATYPFALLITAIGVALFITMIIIYRKFNRQKIAETSNERHQRINFFFDNRKNIIAKEKQAYQLIVNHDKSKNSDSISDNKTDISHNDENDIDLDFSVMPTQLSLGENPAHKFGSLQTPFNKRQK